MTSEIFTGNPNELNVRILALLAAGKTISSVVVTSQRGVYIIIHTA